MSYDVNITMVTQHQTALLSNVTMVTQQYTIQQERLVHVDEPAMMFTNNSGEGS